MVVPMLFMHLETPAIAGQMAAKRQNVDKAHAPSPWVIAGMLLALLIELAVKPHIMARDNLALWHNLGSAFYVLQWLCAGKCAFFDRNLFRFGSFDLTARGQALVTQHAQSFHFGALAATAAVLEHFDIARASHAVFIDSAFFFSAWTPQHKQLADMLNGGCIELVGQSYKHGFACLAIVAQDADFDEA
eukprot:gene9808-12035_t